MHVGTIGECNKMPARERIGIKSQQINEDFEYYICIVLPKDLDRVESGVLKKRRNFTITDCPEEKEKTNSRS